MAVNSAIPNEAGSCVKWTAVRVCKEDKEYAHVVDELDGGEDGGDEQAVDVEGVDGERRAAAQEPVEVDVGDDVAGRAAAREPEDALQVPADGDGRLRQALERRHRPPRRRHRLLRRRRVVALRHPLQQRRQDRDHARHRGLLHHLPRRHRSIGFLARVLGFFSPRSWTLEESAKGRRSERGGDEVAVVIKGGRTQGKSTP